MTIPTVDGSYVIWQLPLDNVHNHDVLNTPNSIPSFHNTEPVGVVFVPLAVSDTTTLYVMLPPPATDEVFGVTITLVVLGHGCITAGLPEIAPTDVPPHTSLKVPELVNVPALMVMVPKFFMVLPELLVTLPEFVMVS